MPGVAGQTEALLGMTEVRIRGGDREIDELDEVDADPGAVAMHLRDDRLHRILERHVVLAELAVLHQTRADTRAPGFAAVRVGLEPVRLQRVVVVVAGTERRAAALEDDHLDVIVGLGIVQCGDETLEIAEAERVVLLRAIQHEMGDRTVLLEQYGVVECVQTSLRPDRRGDC